MSRVYRFLTEWCWGLGVLSIVAGVVFKLAPVLEKKTLFTARGGVALAGVLFLCSLASREMGRVSPPSS
jgi:hypothetical protein